MTNKEIKNLDPENLLLAVKREYDEGILAKLIRKGGEKVEIGNGDGRVRACHGCTYLARVKGYIGCSECGCPLASKAYMKNLLNIKAECPHPDGSRWAAVDIKFQNLSI